MLLRTWLCIGLCLVMKTLVAQTWTPGDTIPLGASNGVDNDIALTYDANTGTVIAAWGDISSNRAAFYSIWDGISWTTAATIPLGTSTGVHDNIGLTYDANTKTIVAAWRNRTTTAAYYAIYNGISWTTAATIPLGGSTGVFNNVALTYDANTGNVVAAWGDAAPAGTPFYSIYNGTSWTPAAIIPPGASNGANVDVALTYDANTSNVVAAWADINNEDPFYSIYNGTSWTPAAAIPAGASSGVFDNISLTYDANTGNVVAAWADIVSHAAYYSIYNGDPWTTAATIPLGASGGVLDNIGLTYDENAGLVVAAWGDVTNREAYYSLYNGSWTMAATIPLGTSNGVFDDVALTYDANTSTVVGAWGDFITHAAFYSIFSAPAALVPPAINKTFNPMTINPNGTSTLTISFTNTNSSAITLNSDFTDSLPAGLTIVGTPTASAGCPGTFSFTSTSLTLTAPGTFAAGATCNITATVQASASGFVQNSTSTLVTSAGTSSAASATLAVGVTSTVSVSKQFSPAIIRVGQSSTMTITLFNSNPTTPATLTANFVDTLPAGVTVANPTLASTTCGGNVQAVPGSNTVTLQTSVANPAVIPTNGSCTITVNVTASLPGNFNNVIPAGSLQTSNGANVVNTSMILFVLPPCDTKRLP